MSVQEFCVAFNAEDFDKTVSFYQDVLEFTPGAGWDRADGRGLFLACGGQGGVEIFGAARGKPALSPPPPGSFMIVVIVADAEAQQRKLIRNGVGIRWKMASFDWGKYFGVVDPNGIGIYFMERLGANIEIARAALQQAVASNRKS
jgi:predicted enzyme related to lactoylglutathione lyase